MSDLSDFSSDAIGAAVSSVTGVKPPQSTNASMRLAVAAPLAPLSPDEEATQQPGYGPDVAELNRQKAAYANDPARLKILTDATSGRAAAPQQPANDPMADFSASAIDQAVRTVTPATPDASANAPKLPSGRPMPQINVDTKGIAQTALNQATALGSSIVGGWRGLATLATGGSLADAANAVHEEQQQGTYEPPAGTNAAEATANLASPGNPMNWIGVGAKKLGEFAQDQGVSPGVATAIETGINAIPLALMGKAGSAGEAKPTIGTVTGHEIPAVTVAANSDVPTIWRNAKAAQAANESAAHPPGVVSTEPAQVPRGVALVPETVEKATGPAAPVAPGMKLPQTNQMASIVAADTAANNAKGFQVPQAEQAARAQILGRVGVDTATKSTLEGNPLNRATEFQLTKFPEPVGEAARAQLDSERQALTNHAENIVKETGGTLGSDESAASARGNAIVAPLQSLKNWFDTKIKALYGEADVRAKGVPTNLSTFNETLNDTSNLTNSDRVQLVPALNAYMKKLGITPAADGSVGATVSQAETIRKYLNEAWSPQNSGFVGKLKDALDNDVTSTAGEDIYKQARAIRAMKSTVFENDITDAQGRTIPNPIAKIVDASGRKLELLKAPKDVPGVIAALPPDQLSNFLNRLDNVPPEIQAEAQAAKAEIKAHFANKLLDTGNKFATQWNAKGVSDYLGANSDRIQTLFGDDLPQMQRIKDLNAAGHILHYEASYPGAAAQAQHAAKAGAMSSLIRPAAAAAGGGIASLFTGGVGTAAGAAAGDYMGAQTATRMGEAAAVKRFQKNQVKLGDIRP